MFPVQIISRKRILLENATLWSLLVKYNKKVLKNSTVVSHSGDFWQKAEELSLKSPEHTVFYLWEASDVTAQPQIFVKRRERKQALLGTQELKPVTLRMSALRSECTCTFSGTHLIDTRCIQITANLFFLLQTEVLRSFLKLDSL